MAHRSAKRVPVTVQLAADPGKNSGVALGYYDAVTPYQLLHRFQVHEGLAGFIRFWRWLESEHGRPDELVCEKFILDSGNEFTADLTPVEIEGALAVLWGEPIIWQPRTAKSKLTGYPASARTKAQRQRVRFNFLKQHGLFKPGTENDDSNDAICHALISLKMRRHYPTLKAFWPAD